MDPDGGHRVHRQHLATQHASRDHDEKNDREYGIPVFLRATRTLGERMSLNLYAGVVTAGELRVEDSSGRKLSQVDSDAAPLFGATFSARF
ncbi:MAG: hypothetical protein ACK4UX_07925 [Thiobacillus sp.]